MTSSCFAFGDLELNEIIMLEGNAFENAVCQMVTILFRHQSVCPLIIGFIKNILYNVIIRAWLEPNLKVIRFRYITTNLPLYYKRHIKITHTSLVASWIYTVKYCVIMNIKFVFTMKIHRWIILQPINIWIEEECQNIHVNDVSCKITWKLSQYLRLLGDSYLYYKTVSVTKTTLMYGTVHALREFVAFKRSCSIVRNTIFAAIWKHTS